MKSAVRKSARILLFILIFLVGFVLLYLLAAWGLSRIAVAREAGPEEVEIYLLSNGVHSDIVVPVANELRDWRSKVPVIHTRGKDSSAIWLAFGWGDKGFYLETPTWNDLSFSTAFKAAFGLSSAAMHTTYYHYMQEGNDCKRIMISKNQYERLIRFIDESFITDAGGGFRLIPTNANYGRNDAFYDAHGRYHLFHTCNTWTNNALKACGQLACYWTPFDEGIFISIISDKKAGQC
ncbi:TIGR02117 family protein [Chitinophaga sedimenti]|uniref:TIGR02117 family protein n=1 Tax=Chitinophaga sedimenti TaxID=2033606 RepID=UPI002005DC93|nr:TIGR02117 family protein [Chitinophaga sedimenti]MCK7559066.1 TIGR02117 family protein [Chitinophaga sedimenti]